MTHRIRPIPRSSRRQFLRQGVGLGVGLTVATAVSTASAGAFIQAELESGSSDRQLRIFNAHTGEKIELVYFSRGSYIDESLAKINHLMRDHRANEEIAMDLALIDQLAEIQQQVPSSEYVHVLSGYRTPATNAALRKRSSNVAKFSLHMEGRAADIHVPGLTTRELQSIAQGLKAGGVGYYGRSGFVHIDTGKIRHWER